MDDPRSKRRDEVQQTGKKVERGAGAAELMYCAKR